MEVDIVFVHKLNLGDRDGIYRVVVSALIPLVLRQGLSVGQVLEAAVEAISIVTIVI